MMRKYTSWVLALLFYGSLLSWNIKPSNAEYFLLKASGVHGDNTGRIKDMSIGSASYTDNGYFSDIITKGPWVDVRAYIPANLWTDVAARTSTADLSSYVQLAATAIPSTGGTLYLPRGTYDFQSVVRFSGKSNITIKGDGMGQTIIRGVTNPGSPGDATYGWGIITVNGVASGANVHNITFEDFTISMPNDAPSSSDEHVLAVNYADNIVANRVHVQGGYYEAFYIAGNTPFWKNVQVTNCKFTNSKSWSFNINSGTVGNVIVSNNIFDNVSNGLQLVGTNLMVTNNMFFRTGGWAIQIGETNAAGRSIGASVVANNTIEELGGNILLPGSVGIIRGIGTTGGLRYGNTAVADNVYDVPIVVANNIITNSFIPAATMGLIPIEITGNALVIGNVITGLSGASGGDTRAISVAAGWGWDNASVIQRTYLDSNIIEKGSPTNQLEWNFVVNVGNASSMNAYFSKNRIMGFSNTTIGLYVGANADNAANVYFDGDYLSGVIYDASKNSVWGTGIAAATISGIPLYGSNKGGLKSTSSDDLLFATFTDNSATPSIAGGVRFKTANTGATTITEFTGGKIGKTISVLFTDNVTTVQNGGNLKLSGATNFVATPNDTLTLLYDGTWWNELDRSVN